MQEQIFNYKFWIAEALKNVVKSALNATKLHGLQNNKALYISFLTTYSKNNIPTFLKEQYPKELTIVLQYEFWNLEVNDDYFLVELSFQGKKTPLTIYFKSLIAFQDTTADIGFRFEIDELSLETDALEALDTEISEESTQKQDAKILKFPPISK